MIRRKQHIIKLIRRKVNEIDNTVEVIFMLQSKRDNDVIRIGCLILLKRKDVDKRSNRHSEYNLLDIELEIESLFQFLFIQNMIGRKIFYHPLLGVLKKRILIP